MRASIDIGSNTILLLIADFVDGKFIELENEARVTSLGKSLDKTLCFSLDSMETSTTAFSDYAEILKKYDIDSSEVLVTATEASRVAKNAIKFFSKIKDLYGFNIKIITPVGEAFYTAMGVVKYMNTSSADNIIIMDIGGASTEFIKIKTNPFDIVSSISLGFGSVRGTDWYNEKCFDEKVEKIFAKNDLSAYQTVHLVCVAGSMNALAGMISGEKCFNANKVQGTIIDFKSLIDFFMKIKKMQESELSQEYPFLGKRSATILAGARLGIKIGEKLGVERFEISTAGLRYGTLLQGEINERYIAKL